MTRLAVGCSIAPFSGLNGLLSRGAAGNLAYVVAAGSRPCAGAAGGRLGAGAAGGGGGGGLAGGGGGGRGPGRGQGRPRGGLTCWPAGPADRAGPVPPRR